MEPWARYTKEYEKLREISFRGYNLTNEEREFVNNVIARLNEATMTNKTVMVYDIPTAAMIAAGGEWEGRILGKEDMQALWAERDRLVQISRHQDILWEIHDITLAFDWAWSFATTPWFPIKTLNDEMQIIPHYFVDIRDGEVRFPPCMQELGDLYHPLIKLMNKPEPTAEDKKEVRRIAEEIYELVKANTPTSAFQMPTAEPR